MEIKVYELNTCGERQIEIRISGELQTSNEKVNLYATYDKDGTMVTCSSGTSMCNNPSYYIDIARFFQKIKDIEGNIAKNAFKSKQHHLPLVPGPVTRGGHHARAHRHHQEAEQDKSQIGIIAGQVI